MGAHENAVYFYRAETPCSFVSTITHNTFRYCRVRFCGTTLFKTAVIVFALRRTQFDVNFKVSTRISRVRLCAFLFFFISIFF